MNPFKKYNLIIKEKIGGHYFFTYIDVILCLVFLGASVNEYFRWTFYEWSWNKRKTFVTSRKEKKLWTENSKEIVKIFGDKAEFVNQYSLFTKRRCLDLSKCTPAEFVEFARNSKVIFLKYLWACGGLGAKKYTFTTDEDAKKQFESLVPEIEQYGLIAEEMIEQHPKMSLVGEKSVNTIRIATYSYKGEPHVIAATLRMGGNGIVDNWSSGGTCAAIDIKTGIVISPCVRDPENQWMRHPVTGTIVPGFEIPHWDKVVQICLDAAKFKKGANYIGWDVAVRENDVVLVEANTNHGIFQIEDRLGKYQFIKQIRRGEYKL